MNAALQSIAKLPDRTKVFPGHEYTETNLRFALSIEPQNTAIQERLSTVRSASTPFSGMGTVEEEKRTNPFMRILAIHQESDQYQKMHESPISLMNQLRMLKNNFK